MPRLGYIEEFQLYVLGFPALLFDVLLDGFSVATTADGSHVVAIRPEFSSPELGFDFGNLQAGFGGEGFDPSDDFSGRIFWQELAEDMDVILVEADLMDIDCKAFLEACERFADRSDHLRFQDGFPVLDRDLDVVMTLGNVVVPAPDARGEINHGIIVSVCCVCLH